LILEIAKKQNYHPNVKAQSLRIKRTMTIGLIVPDIQNPFFGEIVSSIERLLQKHGYSTFLCNSNEDPEKEEFYLESLLNRKVNGIILSPAQFEERNYMKIIQEKTSLVLVDRKFDNTKLHSVVSANTLAAEYLTQELIKLGLMRIAFLKGIQGTYINSV